MEYKETPQSGLSYIHQWDVSSVKVFDGGFLLDKSNLPVGLEKLPRGSYLKIDMVERKAKLIKTVVLHEALTNVATVVKIKKGSKLVATDVIGNGVKAVVVGAITTSDPDFDSFAITADALGTAAKDAVLQTYDSAGSSGKSAVNPDGLNYTDVVIDEEPAVSVIYEAHGIVTDSLPQGTTTAIKGALKFCQFL